MSVPPRRPRERVIRRPIIRPERIAIREPRRARPPHVREPLVLALGFIAAILLGSLLLTLPIANNEATFTPYLTSLFTATSAVCVTGLVVVDTGTYWSPVGQAIILLLIQVGGLGFMTASTFLLLLVGRRVSLTERLLLRASLGVTPLGGIIRLTRQAVVVTAIAEGVGALILFLRFAQEMPPARALWMGVFHSVSAFNNAGFDIVGDFRSLTPYNQDPVVLLTVASLIIIGGLSFAIVLNVVQRGAYKYLALDTKLVLFTSGALLLVGTVAYLLMDFGRVPPTATMPWHAKLLNAFFMAVTPRTAGFNAVDVSRLTEGSILLTIALMYIGGGSGSTAGGIKVNTFAVLSAAVYSSMRGRETVGAFGYELPMAEVARAISIALLALGLIFLVTLVLTLTEPFSLVQIVFEATSAFGTVGLSTGITPDLSLAGKLLIAAMMYVGRIGPLTLALALAQRTKPERFKYPEARVKIG
mgnify:CR=1 FL=1